MGAQHLKVLTSIARMLGLMLARASPALPMLMLMYGSATCVVQGGNVVVHTRLKLGNEGLQLGLGFGAHSLLATLISSVS